MLRISDFAQLTRVSPKALRHYHRLGLLKPDKVDDDTGYRYYSAAQLPRLNRILVFKELGFSLEEIGRLLTEDIALEEIRGMLRLKRSQIEQQLQQDRDRLIRVETRLQELEQEKTMSDYDVLLKPVEAQLVAATVGVIPNYQDCEPIFDRLFERVYSYAYSKGLKKVGYGISIYHDTKLRNCNIPVEVAAAIFEEIPDDEQIWIYQLPEVETMASVIHQGAFTGLGQAYNALLAWIENNSYRIVGSTREIYLQYERDGDPERYITEVQVPLEKASI